MRASGYFLPTLKETPNDAEIASHQLMLRAGLIRKLGSGLYTWLPLGLKVLRKIETIVREELNKSGALEILMPAVQPAELWQETGRWETFGGQLLKMKDNNNRDYCYGPTHEEVVTDLMRQELQSYKQLPLNVYQIQTKFRDEIRPRFGVMRAREFIMKDAYSFHLDEASLHQTYEAMFDAYHQIFNRLGLKFRAVEADTGAIGGSASHEFQVLADSGEDLIFFSDRGHYAANIEQATCQLPKPSEHPPTEALQKIDTPHQKTIDEICAFLSVSPQETLKTLIVEGAEHPFIALVLRGDDELNEVKACKHPLIKSPLRLAREEEVLSLLDCPVGFIGPVGLDIPVIADHFAAAMSSFICGANQEGVHLQHAAWNRDATYQEVFDLRNVKEGDISPDGEGVLHSCRGVEVGHIFKLGDKYAKSMKLEVLNEQGHLQTLIMGCYGLGISRVVAAAIEQHHDEKGICWPASIAPFEFVIIPLNGARKPEVMEKAKALYQQLQDAGIDVLLEDRDERAGVLFADHDLIGIPHRIILSERNLAQHQFEYKSRQGQEPELIDLDTLKSFIKNKHQESVCTTINESNV